jgi:protein PET117
LMHSGQAQLLMRIQAMHEGVIRDMEKQVRVKQERQLDFDMQKALEKEYRKVQDVNDGRK